ncbi:MAG: helix-turn-helix transcriptional regulator [Chloroflexi bacterium]|nr:helix-turn-helix transcriptional regulator [Chloroflexota bacterium]
MDKLKRAKLEKKGWRIGSASEFLELSPEEAVLVEIRLALSRQLRMRRARNMTQTELAKRLGSSQPRVARVERGDRSVSIELLIRAMLATGATPKEIGKTIASVQSTAHTQTS